jgi:NADH:ubiquinone oxidoreductase subunit 6 (subunit J)
MDETAGRVLGKCRIALLVVTAVIQPGLSLAVVTTTAGWSAFATLGLVLVVSSWWVLRGRPVPPVAAWIGAVTVLAAAAVATWAVPPEDLFGNRHWSFGLAGWHLLVLLVDRPIAVVAALGVQVALYVVRLAGSASTDRAGAKTPTPGDWSGPACG